MASFIEVETQFGPYTINVDHIESFSKDTDRKGSTRVEYSGDEGDFIIVSLEYAAFKDLIEIAGSSIKSIQHVEEAIERLGYSKDEARAKIHG